MQNRELTLPRSRSPQPAVDINGFFKLVGEALALCIETEGPPPNGAPIYVQEYAQEKLAAEDQTNDIVVFRVVSGKMASNLNGGGNPKRPSLREAKTHPEKGTGYQIEIYGWYEQHVVEFTLMSRSNINGNILAEWFHMFLMKYAFALRYFLGRGVDNFEFVERNDDPVDHKEGQEVYVRRLSYQFRLNRLYATESRRLTDIDLTSGIGSEIDNVKLKSSL